ncbi:DUF1783-domain-containing protein [Viridothelium virens]|uniref:DUF1783-domain-containing protein n=1 Tax=Viridothelium virens TaxID=1048519 RepID=A0A6A6HN22_VIRVR|nr:DUF1783-domain-containing protein [Viridothelium virens]
MLSQSLRFRTGSRLLSKRNAVSQLRTLIAAPKPGSGPLMSRRSDRALPSIRGTNRWLRTLPAFLLIVTASTFAIFNYQKSSSSVVSSTLYALRTNADAREALGDEVYFASKVPWIRGELNQLHGRINISFWVKGTKAKGLMRFRSERKTRMGYFETLEWSLTMEDGRTLQLLRPQSSSPLPQVIDDNIMREATV